MIQLAYPDPWKIVLADRQQALRSGEEVDMIADPADVVADRQMASASLRTFMRLPVAQRSSVILMDVLGCSLQEVGEVMDFSLPAVKAALHRGRTRLRELANEPADDRPRQELSQAERDRLGTLPPSGSACQSQRQCRRQAMLAPDHQLPPAVALSVSRVPFIAPAAAGRQRHQGSRGRDAGYPASLPRLVTGLRIEVNRF